MTTPDWTAVSNLDALAEDDVTGVTVGGKEIAVYRCGDEIYATANACTHGDARLCDGFLEGHEIECPLHQGRFDVRTGKAMCLPLTEDVRTYPVRIDGGRVFVDLG